MANDTKVTQSGEVEEAHDQQTTNPSGENNSPEAVEGAVEGGWNGSVAGTNEALEPGPNSSQ